MARRQTGSGTAIAPKSGPSSREAQRIHRALKTLSAGNRTLLRASDEWQLLDDMCRVIVEHGGYHQACVGYAQHGADKAINWIACAGTEVEWLEALRYNWADTPLGRNATGTAIRTGKPCVARSLLTDPGYADPAYTALREDARVRGYAAISAFPLRVDGEVIGALAMAAADPESFDPDEVKLLGELADDLGYGIANLRIRVKHHEAEATIARLAYYDPLTGLPNRTRLEEQLEAAMLHAGEQHHALAVLHLEVGRFQEINKVLGYRSGDLLLQEIGRRLAEAAGPEEILARVGDAEFALLLPRAGADRAVQVAQRLLAILHEPVEISRLMVDARVGIGIALFPGHASDPHVLLRRANAALHQKKSGRRGYAIYTGGQEQENTRRLALMGDLRRAIEQNELELYCQPEVNIATGAICGAEALVRWQHPLRGMISTGEFIQLAEHAGLINPLTQWVMESAFSQVHAWQSAGLERALAVNLSAHDLRDQRLADGIRGLFSTWGIRPELIHFELTESALMDDPENALETLTQLKRLDVKLFVDDFGTGYSSLSYLQKLPVDCVKIDQSFVTPMLSSPDSAVIVHSTIELGHNLGLEVVAEGVVSQAVWDRLASLGCDVAQGYLVSMPMPASELQDWEHSWKRPA
ncbi:MAG: putative bifunctional diguanylate cyclase/phosphodiesterase [Noviherbaspirillum sp.]